MRHCFPLKDRQKYIRINKTLILTYRLTRDYLKSSAKSIDISPGGIRFPLRQRLEPGSYLKLEIISDTLGHPIPLTGEVVWIKEKELSPLPFEIGVRFLEITADDLENLQRICYRQKNSGPRINWLG